MTTNNSNSDETTTIDPNTDDLDEFTQLLEGKAKPKEEQEEPVQEEEVAEEIEEESEESEEEEEQETSEDEGDEEDDDDASPEEEEEKAEKPKSRFQERIDQMREKQRLAEERAEAAEQRLKALEEKLVEPEKKQEKKEEPATAEDGRPDPDATNEDGSLKYPKGEYDPNYIADLTRFTFEQERARVAEQEKAEREATEKAQKQQELVNNWQSKLDAAEEAMPDIREKSQALAESFDGIDPEYGDFLATTIMTMDKGPEIMYYLSDNPEIANQIVDSGPVGAALALGRLEAQLASPSPAPKKKPSKTPPPPPINRGKGGKYSVAPDTDDLDAFAKEFLG